jgi:zinc protease
VKNEIARPAFAFSVPLPQNPAKRAESLESGTSRRCALEKKKDFLPIVKRKPDLVSRKGCTPYDYFFETLPFLTLFKVFSTFFPSPTTNIPSYLEDITMSKMKRILVCWGILILAPAFLFAQKYNIYSTKLPNGLEVIAIENAVVPLVTIELDVRNGSFTESPEYNGLSHLYEHMFFKANAAIPSQEKYLERMHELGMEFNGTTGEERVNYFFTFGKDNLKEGFEFMKDAAITPLFLQPELERERAVVIGEYDRNEANPYYYLFREMNKRLWYKYYSRKNPLGERDVILSCDRKKMQTIQNRYYIPNNSALLLAGDVHHEEVFKLAKLYFGSWKRGDDPFKLYPIPEHPPLTKIDTFIVEKPVNAITLQIGWHGPSLTKDTKATYAADVLSFILAQQNSQFQKRLVESGLFTYVGFGYYSLDHTGPINVQAQTTADKFVEAEKALFGELGKLENADYYTDEQLANAKTQLEISEMYSHERPSDFVHTVGFWWAVAHGLDYYLNYVDNLRKVSRNDIDEYVKKYIRNAPYVKGLLMSPDDRKKLFPQ